MQKRNQFAASVLSENNLSCLTNGINYEQRSNFLLNYWQKKIELVLGRNGNMSSLFQSQTMFAVQTYIGAFNGSICFFSRLEISKFILADLGLRFSWLICLRWLNSLI